MSQTEATFTIRSLIVTAFASMIITVVALEITGRIDHNDNKDHAPVGEFEAIHVTPDDPFRMSSKGSELHAICKDSYLAIAADADPSYWGILVDYKNRGVRCHPAALSDPE